MKYFKKEALKGLLGTIGKGIFKVADKGLTGGLIHNIKEGTTVSEPGKLDFNKLIRTVLGSTIPIILLVALLKGWIDVEQLKELLKLF